MKFNELPKTDRSGLRKLEIENARIESVSIDNENHGALTAWLFLKWDGSGCGFGGYKLGNADAPNRSGKDDYDYMAEFVMRCLNTVYDKGYGKWEDLPGNPVRILHEGWGGGVVAIGHLYKDRWFCPRVEFAKDADTE